MLSIVYITFRENCKFEWFIDSLVHQSDENLRKGIQIIIVDGILESNVNESERRSFIKSVIGGKFEFVHVPPKPTRWQGKYRVTSENYFAAANIEVARLHIQLLAPFMSCLTLFHCCFECSRVTSYSKPS